LPLPAGRVLSLLRLRSPIHSSLGSPRSPSPAVRSVGLSILVSTPIPFTIVLFAITFPTFLVAALSRSGTGSPFSMRSAQTSCYSTINAPPTLLHQRKCSFNLGDATRIPVPRSPLTKSIMHQRLVSALTM
jgi:hypothetical protein